MSQVAYCFHMRHLFDIGSKLCLRLKDTLRSAASNFTKETDPLSAKLPKATHYLES